MTTITPDGTPDGTPTPGNCSPPRPSLRPGPVVPGTLTAVSHADQSPKAQHAEKGGPGTYPGAPRPETVRPTPLADLAEQLGSPAPDAAHADAMVTGITHDSRAVRPGDVYAALPGARLHGADFVAQAADLGAAAILTDPSGAERAAATGLPVLVVENPRARMGALAVSIYGAPGEDLLQIGITGTSGKTTTAYLIEGGLRAAAAKRPDGG